MARTLIPDAVRLLAAAMAATAVLASWSLSGRLEQEATLVARTYDLAEAVGTAAAAVQASVARAGLGMPAAPTGCTGRAGEARDLAGAGGTAAPLAKPDSAPSGAGAAGRSAAGEGEAAAAGQAGDLGDHWQAEADATRQLDALHALSLEPGLEWLPQQLVGLRDASLGRMALGDALRHAAQRDGAGTVPGAHGCAGTQGSLAHGAAVVGAEPGGKPEVSEDQVSLLADQLRGEADRRRRDVVARSLARAAQDGRQLVAAAIIGAVLSPSLMLVALRRRPTVQACAAHRAPVSQAVPSRSDIAKSPAANAASDAPSFPAPSREAQGLRVLVVEDNAIVRFSLEAMLSDLGHTVSSAADATGAIGLAGLDPDVLVTDLGLPDLDGLTLAHRLRERRPLLRVVIASGRPGSAPGMVWLQKPFDLDRLRRAVEASETVAA